MGGSTVECTAPRFAQVWGQGAHRTAQSSDCHSGWLHMCTHIPMSVLHRLADTSPQLREAKPPLAWPRGPAPLRVSMLTGQQQSQAQPRPRILPSGRHRLLKPLTAGSKEGPASKLHLVHTLALPHPEAVGGPSPGCNVGQSASLGAALMGG